MKNLENKKIHFKKVTIAKVNAHKIYGGFVNPAGTNDNTEPANCESNVYCYGETTGIYIVSP